MSKATVIEIGEAITEKIRTIGGAENVSFDLVLDFPLPHIRELKIIVAPQSYTRGNKGAASRENPDEAVKFNIAILKKCSGATEIPDMLLLTETIAKGIERQIISRGIVTQVEFDPLYDAENFRTMKVFVAVCTATVKVLR